VEEVEMGKPLTESGWKEVVKKHKLSDPGIQTTLADYESYEKRDDPNEFADRLTALKEISEMAGKLKKDKSLAKNSEVITYLGEMLKAAAAETKKLETRKKQYEKEASQGGSKQLDVQVRGINWEGNNMRGFQAFVEFKAPGFKTVTVSKEFKGGVISFDDISIPPEGTMRLITVSKGEATIAPEGVTKYKAPNKGIMHFSATQQHNEVKVKAKSAREATKKAGAKGTVGADFKIFSASGEVYTEGEDKQASEQEVELTVRFAKESFDLKQD
jgi:hypothetical protein